MFVKYNTVTGTFRNATFRCWSTITASTRISPLLMTDDVALFWKDATVKFVLAIQLYHLVTFINKLQYCMAFTVDLA